MQLTVCSATLLASTALQSSLSGTDRLDSLHLAVVTLQVYSFLPSGVLADERAYAVAEYPGVEPSCGTMSPQNRLPSGTHDLGWGFKEDFTARISSKNSFTSSTNLGSLGYRSSSHLRRSCILRLNSHLALNISGLRCLPERSYKLPVTRRITRVVMTAF